MFPVHGKSYKDFAAFQEFFNNNIKFGGIRFAGPVNGLICIHENRSSGYGPSWSLPIAACNPSLGKIKILPKSPICSSFRNTYKDYRLVIFRNTGFGFDYVTKDYKIVQVLSGFGRNYVEVYSGTTNTWRELARDTLDETTFITKPIKSSCKNGFFTHWRGRRRNMTGYYYENILLSFDMHYEVFQTILTPKIENMEKFAKTKVFAVDSFVLFVYPRYDFNFARGDKWLKIWELKSAGNRRYWTILWNVDFVEE